MALAACTGEMNGVRTLGYLTLDMSPSPLDTIDAAADGGFRSVGIRITGRRPGDPFPSPLGDRSAIAAIRARAAERGVRLSSVHAYQVVPEVAEDELKRVVEAIAELGSRSTVVNVYMPDESLTVDTLARYCELCEPAGMDVALEFVPFSTVRSLDDALRVATRVGKPNLRLVIDALHLARSGGHPDQLRAVDPSRIACVQLCDAKAVVGPRSDEALRRESRGRRLLPGDGDLPLAQLLSAVPSDVEVEYEVPRQDFAALTLAERARVAFSVCNAYLDGLPR